MPHIAITMLPGRDMEKKKALARKLRAFVARELEVDALIVSVSVEDIPLDKWNESMARIPEGAILIPEQEKSEQGNGCKCCC
ncbi:tautomerase family protein [uncultured Alistipes sp.]|jgi:hypothetical protein|uniref:tautomerase family protein n=1 Tax=uncultured Alistipes sp. TaxID=538949 RepID=UPI0025D54F5B|nr:tautomerase family protein [uncultured Alistipes sp.]